MTSAANTPITDAEAEKSIAQSLASILESQKKMIQAVYDFSNPAEKAQYDAAVKDLEISLGLAKAPVSVGGGVLRRRYRRGSTRRARATRKNRH